MLKCLLERIKQTRTELHMETHLSFTRGGEIDYRVDTAAFVASDNGWPVVQVVLTFTKDSQPVVGASLENGFVPGNSWCSADPSWDLVIFVRKNWPGTRVWVLSATDATWRKSKGWGLKSQKEEGKRPILVKLTLSRSQNCGRRFARLECTGFLAIVSVVADEESKTHCISDMYVMYIFTVIESL